MFKGLGDLVGMAEKAQEMQSEMKKFRADLENVRVHGEAGAGLVKATCSGTGELRALDIDPTIFRGDEKELVEDLIVAAIKDAQDKASDREKKEMTRLVEGMGISLPPGMKLPF